MTRPANLPASVRQRLLDRARRDGRPFNELLQYYAMERFLYRLSRSPHADRFVLKGALMLQVWHSPQLRPTMDIDLLGRTSNDAADLVARMAEVLTQAVEPDGLVFDPDTLQTERITEDAAYEGTRLRFRGDLAGARLAMQMDIGFGDIVVPDPEFAELPTLLDFPAPRLLCYSRESTIAEKLQAMIHLGALNSRMKDFYDIWLLSRQFDFAGESLTRAVRLTCAQRGTPLPAEIEAFSAGFVEAKQVQWAAFRRRLQQDQVPDAFAEIVAGLELFLTPVIRAAATGGSGPAGWIAPGPWR